MNGYSSKDMEEGLDCYDPETRIFPKITDKISKGEELIKRNVLLILKWKLGRIKKSNSETVTDKKMAEINKAVRDARTTGGEIDAVRALDAVPGIGLAAATAILTVCYPDEFTIIDQRVSEALNLFPSTLPATMRTSKGYSTDAL
jgi:hypothetical protein